MRRVERIAFPVTLAYLWIMMTLFGAIVLETFMIYPNVFHDPPRSLELGTEFLAVAGPSDFFPPLGLLSWILGASALAVTWRVPGARWWVLASLMMIVAEGLVSMAYFWPRNEIMFVEGLQEHSAGYLRQVAREFETWHARSRLGFNTVAAVTAFAGFLAVHRQRVASRGAREVPVPNVTADRAPR